MDFKSLLGRATRLSVRRFTPSGAFFADPRIGERRAVFAVDRLRNPARCPGRRCARRVRVPRFRGSPARDDSKPKLSLGEVGFLRVTAWTQLRRLRRLGTGQRTVGAVRRANARATRGIARANRRLPGQFRTPCRHDADRRATRFRAREFYRGCNWVEGEAWRNDPEIGLFAILERRIPGHRARHRAASLTRGQAARFRVSHILHADGKVECSLRAHAHEELENDAETVLRSHGEPRHGPKVGDHSSAPSRFRQLFGLSKKAFKRAAGRLLKQGLVDRSTLLGCLAPGARWRLRALRWRVRFLRSRTWLSEAANHRAVRRARGGNELPAAHAGRVGLEVQVVDSVRLEAEVRPALLYDRRRLRLRRRHSEWSSRRSPRRTRAKRSTRPNCCASWHSEPAGCRCQPVFCRRRAGRVALRGRLLAAFLLHLGAALR